MNRLFRVVVAHPWAVLALTAALTLALGVGLGRLAKDDSSDKMLPDSDPVLRYTREMEEVFSSDEFIVVAVESSDPFGATTVAKLVRLTARLAAVPGVREVVGPTNTKNVRGAAGEMYSEPLVDDQRPPTAAADLEAFRSAITGKRLFRGSIISESGRAFGLGLRLEKDPDKKAIVAAVREIVDEERGPEEIYFSGSPAINIEVSRYMGRDMAKYLPLVLALIVGTLWVNFRSLRGVWLPLAAIFIPVLWTLGLQGWLGVPISVIGTMIPTILIAVGVSYSVHVLAEYYECAPGRPDRREAVRETMASIAPTIGLAGVSTVIGFGSLLANDTPILREFGWITSFGIASAMLVAVTFVPASLALMKTPAPRARAVVAGGATARLLAAVVRFNGRRRGVALAAGAGLLLAALAGFPRLSIETNVINFFKRDDPVRATIGRVSAEFGGTITIRTIIEGPAPDTILRPEYLRQMEDYQRFLEGFDRVGKTLSIADLIKDMNMALHEGDPAYLALPDTQRAAEQYLFLYSLSSDPDEFESLIDSSRSKATVTARLRQVDANNDALGTGETRRILARIEEYAAAHFSPELRVTPTGRAQDIVRSSEYIVTGLIRSMATAVVPIWLLVSLIFRSPLAGLFGIATTAVGLVLNFGVMGWLGIPLDIATTLISSIAIGIGVDDAVHYLLRLRRTMRRGVADPAQAMAETLGETGRAIVFTSTTMVLGFSIFMVASFRPVVYFGGLTALSMLTTSVAALLIVPPLLLMARPRFLARGVPAGAAAAGEIDNPAGRP